MISPRPTGTITITLTPQGDTQYSLALSHDQLHGGWETVYHALLGGLQVTLAQLYPEARPDKAPVFQAMLNVLRHFLAGLLAGKRPEGHIQVATPEALNRLQRN